MKWEQILAAVLGAFELGSLSFTCGGFLVKVSTKSGAPAHFTLAAAVAAAEQIFFEQHGAVQIGDVVVTVSEGGAPASSTATSQKLAAAIAEAVRPMPAPAAKAPAAISPASSAAGAGV